jgi:hypothetical protein
VVEAFEPPLKPLVKDSVGEDAQLHPPTVIASAIVPAINGINFFFISCSVMFLTISYHK